MSKLFVGSSSNKISASELNARAAPNNSDNFNIKNKFTYDSLATFCYIDTFILSRNTHVSNYKNMSIIIVEFFVSRIYI